MNISPNSHQPARLPWSMDRLVLERSILMGMAINLSTTGCYSSAVNSYLTFCNLHKLAPKLTADTLSLYITWQSAHIDPKSVNSYLSGICNNLEPFYPDIHKLQLSLAVSCTLKGAKWWHGRPVKRKSPLLVSHLAQICNDLANSTLHNNKLFLCILTCGFSGLHRLGKLTDTDSPQWKNAAKTISRSTLMNGGDHFSYTLPGNKTDTAFEGSWIVIKRFCGAPDPQLYLNAYLASRNGQFRLHPQIFLLNSGKVPTCSWFLAKLKKYLVGNYAGQSLWAGGATMLAESGAPPDLIMGAGRWSSDTFRRYIRKNPVLMYALIGHHSIALNAPS